MAAAERAHPSRHNWKPVLLGVTDLVTMGCTECFGEFKGIYAKWWNIANLSIAYKNRPCLLKKKTPKIFPKQGFPKGPKILLFRSRETVTWIAKNRDRIIFCTNGWTYMDDVEEYNKIEWRLRVFYDLKSAPLLKIQIQSS